MPNAQHSIATYVSDMLALEKHIRAPFLTQLDDGDFREYQDTTDVVTRLVALTDGHIASLTSALERLDGHEAAPVKDAVGSVGGVVAGVIDKVRKTKISKALRDDYAALAFTIAGYVELLTSANAVDNLEVSALAQRHLEDYAGLLVELAECIPAVVIRELSELGLDVDPAVSLRTRQTVHQAWRSRTPERANASS